MSERAPRFLVIRRDNIGDLACTTPLIAGLRARYPQAFIAALVNTYNRDVLAGNPDVDEIHAYTKAKHREPGVSRWRVYADTWRLLGRLRERRFDCAVLATPRFRRHDVVFARLAGAQVVVGFVDRPNQGVDIGVLRQGDRKLHEVEDVWQLAPPLRIEGPPPAMKVVADAVRRERISAGLRAVFGEARGPVVALHISARRPLQRWPVERFAELGRRLHELHGARLVVLWSPGSASDARHPGDDERAAALERLLAGVPVHCHPTQELAELIAALDVCDAVICPDGGAMHLAAALGKPVVCLFGDSDPERWRPWKARHELLRAPSGDVKDIGVEEVVRAFARLADSGEGDATGGR